MRRKERRKIKIKRGEKKGTEVKKKSTTGEEKGCQKYPTHSIPIKAIQRPQSILSKHTFPTFLLLILSTTPALFNSCKTTKPRGDIKWPITSPGMLALYALPPSTVLGLDAFIPPSPSRPTSQPCLLLHISTSFCPLCPPVLMLISTWTPTFEPTFFLDGLATKYFLSHPPRHHS